MNEEQKVNNEKAGLPLKTKIAMWWLSILGVAAIIALIIGMIIAAEDLPYQSYSAGWATALLFILPAIIVIEILIFLPVIFLGKKKGRSWAFAVGLMSVYIIATFIYIIWAVGACLAVNTDHVNYFGQLLSPGIAVLVVMFVPLFLTIFDKKKYSEIVRQRELTKNDIKPQQKLRL
jgi:hypothetical protein